MKGLIQFIPKEKNLGSLPAANIANKSSKHYIPYLICLDWSLHRIYIKKIPNFGPKEVYILYFLRSYAAKKPVYEF